MGTLLKLSDFRVAERSSRGFDTSVGHLDPTWYFPKCEYVGGSGAGWHYEIDIESGFPYSAAIHFDRLTDTGKPTLRRFVERSCSGTALFYTQDKSYEYLYRPEEKYRDLYRDGYRRPKVKHGYNIFAFEEASDQMLFSLKFADFVTSISDRHPTMEVEEELIEHAKREPYLGERSGW